MTKFEELFTDRREALEAQQAWLKFVSALNSNGNDTSGIENEMSNMLEDTGITFLDMVDVMRNPPPRIMPSVGQVDNAVPMFYRGCVNTIFGTDSVGKTLIMQNIVLEELRAGNHVVWVDYEEQTPNSFANRMTEFGLQPEEAANLHAVFISSQLRGKDIDVIVEQAERSSLVVLDSVGEYLAAHGANENFDDEVSRWLFAHFARALAATGTAVVLVDHAKKIEDGTMSMTAAGSKRKRAGITGAAYSVHQDESSSAFSSSQSGVSLVTCVKDRHGNRRRAELVGEAWVTPIGQGTDTDHLTVRIAKDSLLAPDPIEVEHQKNLKIVLEAVGDFEGHAHNLQAIHDRCDILMGGREPWTRKALNSMLYELEAAGQIVCGPDRAWLIANQKNTR